MAENAQLNTSALSAAAFKRRQHSLDALIDQTENLILVDAAAVPEGLRSAIKSSLSEIYGTAPPWLDQIKRPVDMLDHLFVAEGRLRQQHYAGIRLELDEAG